MSFDRQTVYELLPALYRIRDAEQGKPLEALLAVITEQITVLEENLAQLYDDQFIETCADWVVPYIGDLIGYRALYGATPRISSPRAEVANTIGYRRRKGTVLMLEQLARDITGWPSHVVEFFQLLATTQYMKHLRLEHLSTPDLRQWQPLERLNTSFDTMAHTAEMRHINNRRGRYNIPNIGIFLWRLGSYSLTNAPAFKLDERRYFFSPLGTNTALFNLPHVEPELTAPSTPLDVPTPISRRAMDANLEAFYGPAPRSLLLTVDGKAVLPDPQQPNQTLADLIEVCNLSDSGSGWAHVPQDKIALDPVLGRIAFAQKQPVPGKVEVTFHYGFSADMGGGEYEREQTLPLAAHPVLVPDQQPTLQAALASVGDAGTLEITNSGRYAGPTPFQIGTQKSLEIRAANLCRPVILPNDLGNIGEIEIAGAADSTLTLNGLLIGGYTLRLSGPMSRVTLRHCTLVPGLTLAVDGTPQHPMLPALILDTQNTQVEIDHCVLGGIRVADDSSSVSISDSIVDACSLEGIAYAATDNLGAGGPLRLERCTVIGKVHASVTELISNSLLLARLSAQKDPWAALLAPIISERRQEGCVRYSFLPYGSRVPRRYACQPTSAEDEARVSPQFTSLAYGAPGYCQLSQRTAIEILQGGEDDLEMGAFYELAQPQRLTNLRVRLDEYLRFGLEAGVFFAT